jgi:hypothetical protein
MDGSSAGIGYAEHLTDADLRLLAAAGAGQAHQIPAASGGSTEGAGGASAVAARLRRDPEALQALLADPRVFEAIFGAEAVAAGEAVVVSPFLAFAVAVHRAVADLASVDYVPERSAARQRVPVFDAPELRDFLAAPARRLFLAELLASFTRVASGRYRVSAGGRQRTRRFSELDPVRLAGLLDAVPDESRPGIYRRLGDVALFLTGVFPDYVASRAFGPVSAARLLRAAQVPAREQERFAATGDIELLEHLGTRWYRCALALAPVRTAHLAVVGEVAERFRQARRVLNHVADRYLLGPDSPWFAHPAH